MTDQEIIDKLRAEHGVVFHFEVEEEGLVAFRRMSQLEYRAWKMNRDDDTKKHVADEILAVAVVVHPDRETFSSILSRQPALATVLTGEVIKRAGGVTLDIKKG